MKTVISNGRSPDHDKVEHLEILQSPLMRRTSRSRTCLFLKGFHICIDCNLFRFRKLESCAVYTVLVAESSMETRREKRG